MGVGEVKVLTIEWTVDRFFALGAATERTDFALNSRAMALLAAGLADGAGHAFSIEGG